ncbi:MAG: DUF2165 family protein [bacterium]
MLRVAKSSLVLIVACWGVVGGMHNLIDWPGTLGAVTAATTMTTFENGASSWQATSNSMVIWLGAMFIVSAKFASAGCCAVGAWRMWRARQADPADFQASKKLALTGCAIALLMLFGGFIVVAESWFELWRSDAMRGPVLDSAFRYGAMIALIALFVGSRDE